MSQVLLIPVPLWQTLLAVLVSALAGFGLGRIGRNRRDLDSSLGSFDGGHPIMDGSPGISTEISLATHVFHPYTVTENPDDTVLQQDTVIAGAERRNPRPDQHGLGGPMAGPLAASPAHAMPGPESGARSLDETSFDRGASPTPAFVDNTAELREALDENSRLRDELTRHRRMLAEAGERVRDAITRERANSDELRAAWVIEQNQSREKGRLIRLGQDHLDSRSRLARQFDAHMRHRAALLAALEATLKRTRNAQSISETRVSELRRELRRLRQQQTLTPSPNT